MEYDSDERQKSLEFKEQLIKHQREMGIDNFKVPSIGGRELDLFKLYKSVIGRGGSHRVSTNKLWKEIVNEFEIPASCTSASFTLRNHYTRCLFQYENKYFHGNMDDGFGNLTEKRYANREGLPSSYAGGSYLADGVPPPTRGRPVDMSNYPSFMPPNGFPHGGSIYTSGSAMAASVNFNSKYSSVKKVSLSYTEAESKRLVLAFESRT